MSRSLAGALFGLLFVLTVATSSSVSADNMAANGRKLKWGGYSGSWSGSWGSTSVNVQPGSSRTTVNTPWYSGSWGSNWGGGGSSSSSTTTTSNDNSDSTNDNNTPAPSPDCYNYDDWGTKVTVGCDGSTSVTVNGKKR